MMNYFFSCSIAAPSENKSPVVVQYVCYVPNAALPQSCRFMKGQRPPTTACTVLYVSVCVDAATPASILSSRVYSVTMNKVSWLVYCVSSSCLRHLFDYEPGYCLVGCSS